MARVLGRGGSGACVPISADAGEVRPALAKALLLPDAAGLATGPGRPSSCTDAAGDGFTLRARAKLPASGAGHIGRIAVQTNFEVERIRGAASAIWTPHRGALRRAGVQPGTRCASGAWVRMGRDAWDEDGR
jgi:hypothetical protein